MGGLGGHINHIYEDFSLKFTDFFAIIDGLSSGDIDVVEKTDGLNLYVTNYMSVRAARNVGDMRSMGLDRHELESRFDGRPSLARAFGEGFAAISRAMTKGGARWGNETWYSVEIMHEVNRNVIPYTGNHVVFHTENAYLNANGKFIPFKVSPEVFSSYTGEIDGWKLHSPHQIELEWMDSTQWFNHLKSLLERESMPLSSTVGAYAQKRIARLLDFSRADLGYRMAAYIMKLPGHENLRSLRRGASHHDDLRIDDGIANARVLLKEALRPFERLVLSFGIARLKDLKSAYVADSDDCVLRIRQQITHAWHAIQKSGEKKNIDQAREHLSKFSLNDVAGIEGLVFYYQGRVYKLTGAFAPINQLLGIIRYG